MFWTLELASSLDDAPWPATKEELIDYATRTCAPDEVIENLEELDDDIRNLRIHRRHLAGLSHQGRFYVE